jgi:uncharacterized protein (TIGR02466 family)
VEWCEYFCIEKIMRTLDIFPKAIGRELYPDRDSLKKEIIDMMDGRNMYTNTMNDKLHHYDNTSGKSFLHRKEMSEFKQWLEDQCTSFVSDDLGYEVPERMIITDSWLNLCDKGGGQYPHFHTNAYISGTYYVNWEEGHAPLFFRHPDGATHSHAPSISLMADKNKLGKYNCDVIMYPEEGELMLWQSNLTHGYSDNQKDGRISISMNFMPSLIVDDKYSYRVSTT